MTARIRKLFRLVNRASQDSGLWPVALLLVALLVSALSLVWFMTAAMRNEQLAVRHQVEDLYRVQLASIQTRLEKEWSDRIVDLERHVQATPPATAFLKCLQMETVDTVVIMDEQRRVVYPNLPAAPSPSQWDSSAGWREANRLEYIKKDFASAANAYAALATNSPDANATARSLQAQARCFVQSGQKDAATQIITGKLSDKRFDRAVDVQGRVIAANADLMALELVGDSASPLFRSTADRLRHRLIDYENSAFASSQRRFLMKELQKLSSDVQFSTLAAEELAAQWSDKGAGFPEATGLHRSPIPGLWQFSTPNRRVIGLVRIEKLMPPIPELPNADVALLPPDVENPGALVSLAAGSHFPGWRLALSLKDPQLFATATRHRTALYLWTAIIIVLVVGVLAAFGVRLMRRQVAIARLKNDLAATVSHELKTPLASMRVLVDTLRDSTQLKEQQVHEYLELISRENERLSRLVQNFLTFSRMDRKKHGFQFAPVSPGDVVEGAIKTASDRLDTPGCRLEVRVEPNLPEVLADSDALTTALVNLLDNACKYSSEIKTIAVKARAENGNVMISVQDNGIGIPSKDLKKVFRDFYQVDQRLSRERGGCGLGLSIVKFIVDAHRGNVFVESEPGRGSTFTITLPAAIVNAAKREATA